MRSLQGESASAPAPLQTRLPPPAVIAQFAELFPPSIEWLANGATPAEASTSLM